MISLRSFFWISLLLDTSQINIIEFIGSVGNQYFLIRKIIKDYFKINWYVIERESQVKAIKKFWKYLKK